MKPTPMQAGIRGGLGFAITWGVFMWFIQWREDTSPLAAVFWAAAGGVLFGLFMASLTRRAQRREPP